MSWNIKYPANLKAKAKADDRDMIAIGADTFGGRAEAVTSVQRGMASALFRFVHLVILGDSPTDAFGKVAWPSVTAPDPSAIDNETA